MPTFKIPRLGRPSAPSRPDVASDYVEEARRRLKEGKTDTDALFTLAAWHAVNRENRKSIAILHRLTQLDPAYPGVWRLEAPAFRQPRGGKMGWLGGGGAGARRQRGAGPRPRGSSSPLPPPEPPP